jgi:hypothetical protein
LESSFFNKEHDPDMGVDVKTSTRSSTTTANFVFHYRVPEDYQKILKNDQKEKEEEELAAATRALQRTPSTQSLRITPAQTEIAQSLADPIRDTDLRDDSLEASTIVVTRSSSPAKSPALLDELPRRELTPPPELNATSSCRSYEHIRATIAEWEDKYAAIVAQEQEHDKWFLKEDEEWHEMVEQKKKTLETQKREARAAIEKLQNDVAVLDEQIETQRRNLNEDIAELREREKHNKRISDLLIHSAAKRAKLRK